MPIDPSSLRANLLLISLPILAGALWKFTADHHGDLRPDAPYREKRKTKRTKSDALFDLEDGNGSFTQGNARLVDISAWGACISTSVPLKLGQRIRGRVRSVEGLLRVSGRIAWTRPKHGHTLYGITFEEVTRQPS